MYDVCSHQVLAPKLAVSTTHHTVSDLLVAGQLGGRQARCEGVPFEGALTDQPRRHLLQSSRTQREQIGRKANGQVLCSHLQGNTTHYHYSHLPQASVQCLGVWFVAVRNVYTSHYSVAHDRCAYNGIIASPNLMSSQLCPTIIIIAESAG